jgi:hypothetical protein
MNGSTSGYNIRVIESATIVRQRMDDISIGIVGSGFMTSGWPMSMHVCGA